MSEITELNDEKLRNLIDESTLPVFIEFYGPFCMPCKKIEPTLKDLAKEYENKVMISKINGDNFLETTEEFKATVYPTFLTYYKGKQIEKKGGAQGRRNLVKMLDKAYNYKLKRDKNH